jgi:hypothetical protein
VTGVCRCQGLVLEHAGQDQHATVAAVTPIARDVIGVAIHQPLQGVGAMPEARLQRRRELSQLLTPLADDLAPRE